MVLTFLPLVMAPQPCQRTGRESHQALTKKALAPSHHRVQRKKKRNTRGQNAQKWSVEHKKVLLHCYHYSRYENWSRKSGEILAEKIRDSDLPEDKKNTNIPNLRSIVSQIGKYLLPEDINTIKDEALRSAERD